MAKKKYSKIGSVRVATNEKGEETGFYISLDKGVTISKDGKTINVKYINLQDPREFLNFLESKELIKPLEAKSRREKLNSKEMEWLKYELVVATDAE